MKMLTSEITKLLDKLYNLRGEDSVILSKMETERKVAEETKTRSEAEKETLQEKITNLSNDESVLASQGERLVSVLENIKNEDFKFVLDKLNVAFNPDSLSDEVGRLLPKTIEKVQNEKENAKNELVKVESEMNTAIATIEELGIRQDEALSHQARLNEIFELALNGNINITRDSITSLLEKFDFTEDEQREAAKILMFPEDALYDYENKLKMAVNPGKSISEVFAEAKENVDSFEPIQEEHRLSPREELVSILKELGFDYLEFTNNDIDKILANYNENDLKHNVMYAKEKGIKLDMFIDNVELLYDKEFESKINRLLEVGKEPFDIYLNPNILIKYNKENLDNTIERLINSGLDPKKVPLIAY